MQPSDARQIKRRGQHVLMIDDNVEVQHVFRRVLEFDGFEVTTARSGAEGLARAAEQHFDLVITDLMLPDMSGYAIARALRAAPATTSVPIAAFTVRSGLQDEVQAYEAGCNDLIAKPCPIDQFLLHVH